LPVITVMPQDRSLCGVESVDPVSVTITTSAPSVDSAQSIAWDSSFLASA